jgi:surfeit locus 1 family protein
VVTKKNVNHSDTKNYDQSKPRKRLIQHGLWMGFTLIVFAILVKLSLWQHGRGIEKQQRLTRITQLNQQSPLTLEQLILLATNGAADSDQQKNIEENINDYPVTILGHFDNEKVFLLDNQVEEGSLGYRVFQMVTNEKYAVLVNLGWIKGSIDRQELPTFTPIAGLHRFTGHIRVVEPNIMLMAQNFKDVTWPLRVQQIEIAKFATLLNQPLLPFAIYLDEEEELGYKKNWHAIVMPPEKHQAYAIQWAGLALAWLVLMIWFNVFERGSKQNNNKKMHSHKETPDE